MANTKISALTDGGALQAGDDIPINRGGSNFRLKGSAFTGGGGGGGGPAIVVDEAYTAVSGDDILADTSGGSFTINVPDDGAAGDWFRINDSTDSFATNPLTIGKNGQTVMGLDEDMDVSSKGVTLDFYHNGSTWRLRGTPLS